MPVESWEAWCSHLCLNTKKLHMDANLSEAGVSAGTLSQQMRCQFTDLREALNRSQVEDVSVELSTSYHFAKVLQHARSKGDQFTKSLILQL